MVPLRAPPSHFALLVTVSFAGLFVVALLPLTASLLATLEAPSVANDFVRTLHVTFSFPGHLGVTWTAINCVFLTFCFSCPSSPFSSSVPCSSLSSPKSIGICWRMTQSQKTTCSSWTSSSSSPSVTFSTFASPVLLAGSHSWRSLFLAQFPVSSLVLAVNFGLVSPIRDDTRRSWACIRSLGSCDSSSGTYLFGRSSSVGSSSQPNKLTSLMVRSSKAFQPRRTRMAMGNHHAT